MPIAVRKTSYLIIFLSLSLVMWLFWYGKTIYRDLVELRQSEVVLFQENEKLEHNFRELQRALGFGGFIHNVKEYLLQRNPLQLMILEANVREIENSYFALKRHFQTYESERAIVILDRFVFTIHEKLDILSDKENQSLSPQQLDALLNIEAPETMSALVTLESLKDRFSKTSVRQIRKSIDALVNDLLLGSIVLPVIVAIGFYLVWLLNAVLRSRQELEEARQLLLDNEEWLEATGELARVGGWELEAQSLKIKWTEETYRIYGIPSDHAPSLEEVLGSYPPESLSVLKPAMQLALEEGRPFDLEMPFINTKGGKIFVRVVCRPIEVAGRVVKIRGAIQDITEKRELRERLQQRDKMDSIGQLAGGIAHDFNNQLSGIMGYAEILRVHLADTKLKVIVDKLFSCAQNSAALTTKLLAFSRKGQMRKETLDIHQMLTEVTGILEHSIDKQIVLRKKLSAAQATTVGDASPLQNAFLNLALNARDAISGAGEIGFATSNIVLSQGDCLDISEGLTPGKYIKIQVCDNGCGIPAGQRQRIFEPFFTTKGLGKGTGMGLAAVYGTIKSHQGVIVVDSEKDVGTTFSVYLPLGEMAKADDLIHGVDSALLHGLRVLLIDDEESIRTLSRQMLGLHGCKVHAEADGVQGVAYYQKCWQELDLVVLDMIMPQRGGAETFQDIRAINPAACVLLASGHREQGVVDELLAAGAAGFLPKPYSHNEFLAAIQAALKKTVA